MKAFITVACLAVATSANPALVRLSNGQLVDTPLVNTYMGSPLLNTLATPFTTYIQPTMKMVEPVEEKKVEVEVEDVEKVEDAKVQQPIVYTTNPWATPYAVNPFYTQVVAGPRYVAKNGDVEHIVAKREADAQFVAANPISSIYPGFYNALPAMYPTQYINAVPTNKATFVNPFTMDVTDKITNDAITAENYASKNQYYARAPGSNTVHVAKREAEADPLTIISNPLMYNNLAWNNVAAPSVYRTVAAPAVYRTVAAPAVYRTVAAPAVYSAPTGVEGVFDGKTVANDAWQFTPAYAGKGMYDARTPGSRHVAKREADPLTIYRSPSLYNNFGLYPRVSSPFVSTYSNVIPRTTYLAGSPYVNQWYY
jgi:hypothetical protein